MRRFFKLVLQLEQIFLGKYKLFEILRDTPFSYFNFQTQENNVHISLRKQIKEIKEQTQLNIIHLPVLGKF